MYSLVRRRHNLRVMQRSLAHWLTVFLDNLKESRKMEKAVALWRETRTATCFDAIRDYMVRK